VRDAKENRDKKKMAARNPGGGHIFTYPGVGQDGQNLGSRMAERVQHVMRFNVSIMLH